MQSINSNNIKIPTAKKPSGFSFFEFLPYPIEGQCTAFALGLSNIPNLNASNAGKREKPVISTFQTALSKKYQKAKLSLLTLFDPSEIRRQVQVKPAAGQIRKPHLTESLRRSKMGSDADNIFNFLYVLNHKLSFAIKNHPTRIFTPPSGRDSKIYHRADDLQDDKIKSKNLQPDKRRTKKIGKGKARRKLSNHPEPFRPVMICQICPNDDKARTHIVSFSDAKSGFLPRPALQYSATNAENWEFISQHTEFKILLYQNGEAKAYFYQPKTKRKDWLKYGRQRSILEAKPPTRKKGESIELNGLTRHAKKCIRIVSDCYNEIVKDNDHYDNLNRFITLTFRRLIPSDQDCKKLLNTFLQRLRRYKKAQTGSAKINYLWVAERQKGQKLKQEVINDQGKSEVTYKKSYRQEKGQSVLHFHILTPERLAVKGQSGHEAADKMPECIALNRIWNEIVLDFFFKSGKITKTEAEEWKTELDANEAYNSSLAAYWLALSQGGKARKPTKPAESKYLLLPNLSYAMHAGAYMAKYMSKENANICGNFWNMSQESRKLLVPIETGVKTDAITAGEILNFIDNQLSYDEKQNENLKKHYRFECNEVTPKAQPGDEPETIPAQAIESAEPPPVKPVIAKKEHKKGVGGIRYGITGETPAGTICNSVAIARGIWSRRGKRVLALYFDFIEMLGHKKFREKQKILKNIQYICEN